MVLAYHVTRSKAMTELWRGRLQGARPSGLAVGVLAGRLGRYEPQLLVGRVGFEAVGDRAQGLAHHQEDEVRIAAGPGDPLGHRGDLVSHEVEDAGGEVSGERDLLGGLVQLGGVVVGARTVSHCRYLHGVLATPPGRQQPAPGASCLDNQQYPRAVPW
jgi:hypothetical protein